MEMFPSVARIQRIFNLMMGPVLNPPGVSYQECLLEMRMRLPVLWTKVDHIWEMRPQILIKLHDQEGKTWK